ncbi:Uncharacterised protein [Serratia fonticola]|nr:Uncharacterised protein [Serratia fonticola]
MSASADSSFSIALNILLLRRSQDTGLLFCQKKNLEHILKTVIWFVCWSNGANPSLATTCIIPVANSLLLRSRWSLKLLGSAKNASPPRRRWKCSFWIQFPGSLRHSVKDDS